MMEPSSFDKLIGTTTGTYRLEQIIERSEWSAVFLARNDAGTMYRLRMLAVPTDLTSEARIVYLGHFQQQANQVAALQHPYILPLLDYGNYEGMPYLVSPHFPMRSLSTQLVKYGPMDVLSVSRYLDQIAAALEYAHQHATLHRSLTTDCIFLKQDGNLNVADSGLMRMLELSNQDARVGRVQVPPLRVMNEASNPAPEQILGNPVDTYTDVYALGGILYRMLTGHRVFRGKTRDEIIQQHLSTPVPALSKWRSDLSAEIDTVIARAMAKEPTQRFGHPGDLANAYHQIVAPNDTQRKPFVIAPTLAELDKQQPASIRLLPGSQWSRQTLVSRRRILIVGGGAAAIVAVAVFGSRYLVGSTSPTASSNPQSTTAPPHNGPILARTSDVPLNSAQKFAIPNSNSNNPGLLIHLPDDRFVAFDSTCTHAGCPVNYSSQEKLLRCPCHDAVFDPTKDAAVVQGPAKTPLAKVNITVNVDGTITAG
ncbi:MAG: hypothetical protein PVS3B3_10160 [Ktedonobacteraceae bacterium]